MVAELTTSFALSWFTGFISLNGFGLFIVILIWAATGLFSVPAHSKLEKSKNDEAINKLILTNWIHTILWTMKTGVSFYLLMKFMS